jgi:hypothetical protein
VTFRRTNLKRQIEVHKGVAGGEERLATLFFVRAGDVVASLSFSDTLGLKFI